MDPGECGPNKKVGLLSPVSQHLPYHLPLPQPQSPYFHVNGRPQPSKLVNQPPAPQRRRRVLTQAHCPYSGSRLPWHLPGLWAWTNPFSGLFIALVPPQAGLCDLAVPNKAGFSAGVRRGHKSNPQGPWPQLFVPGIVPMSPALQFSGNDSGLAGIGLSQVADFSSCGEDPQSCPLWPWSAHQAVPS